jgi:serine/threonine protein kinase/Tfp pilus assembly protein PilF
MPSPGQTLSHYRIVEKIGEGGMCEVWKAVDTHLDRGVAIKILPPDFRDDADRLARLEKEAKAVAALNHPNIVTIHSIEEHAGERFITMELLQGRPLSAQIPAGGFPLKRFFDLAIPMIDAVSAAHAHGIVHRDLKPANVMLADDGVVKVLDFGLARSREEPVVEMSEATTETLDQEGRISGTLSYMSPEQIEGRPVDHLSDIFSLGIILYEMATGRRPFGGKTTAAVLASTLKDTPPPTVKLNAEIPRHLDRVIRRCLEKDPGRRLQSSLDLRNDLEALQREIGSLEKEAVPSIAVLPFVDMSVERDQDYFCEGIAEEIINALTHVRELRVASRTSSIQFKATSMDSREIGDRLGVSTLLEGSVRKADEQLRVHAQLISVASGYHLWAGRYDRELKDVFAIQDEIAQAIVQALKVTLSPQERRAIRQVATTDARAYDYYLRGRKYYYQYRLKGIEFALQMFSRAIEIDPSYAQAYAGVADCCAYLCTVAGHGDETRERADAASRKALELDSELAEAHASRGVVLLIDDQHEAAEQAFEMAIQLNPRLFEAHFFYARACFTQGKFDEAIRRYEEAARVRADDYQSLLLVGQVFDDLGRTDEAAEARRRGVRRVEDRLDLNPDDTRALYMGANGLVMGANGLVALGERERGLEWARRAREIEPDESMVLYNLACVYSLEGEVEEGIDCLERAVDHGFTHVAWFRKDSNLDALRAHPRFGNLLGRLERAQQN